MPDPKIMSKLKKILWKAVGSEKRLIGCQEDAPCCNDLMPFCTKYNCNHSPVIGVDMGPQVSPLGVSAFVKFTGFANGNNCQPADPDNDEGVKGSRDCGFLNDPRQFVLGSHIGGEEFSEMPFKWMYAPRAIGEFDNQVGCAHSGNAWFGCSYEVVNGGQNNAVLNKLGGESPEWVGTDGGFVVKRPERDPSSVYYPGDAPPGTDAQTAKRYGFDATVGGEGGAQAYYRKHISCLYHNPIGFGNNLWETVVVHDPDGLCGNIISPWHKWGDGIHNAPVDSAEFLNVSDAAIEPNQRDARFNARISAHVYYPDFGKEGVNTNFVNVDVGLEIVSFNRIGHVTSTQVGGSVQLFVFSEQFDSDEFYCHSVGNLESEVEQTTHRLPFSDSYTFASPKSEWPGWDDDNFSVCDNPDWVDITFVPQVLG